jgi:hypothetical protein
MVHAVFLLQRHTNFKAHNCGNPLKMNKTKCFFTFVPTKTNKKAVLVQKLIIFNFFMTIVFFESVASAFPNTFYSYQILQIQFEVFNLFL